MLPTLLVPLIPNQLPLAQGPRPPVLGHWGGEGEEGTLPSPSLTTTVPSPWATALPQIEHGVAGVACAPLP